MKKLNIIFLYLTLATAPIYSMNIASVFFTAFVGAFIPKAFEIAQTRFSVTEGLALIQGKDLVIKFLSSCGAYLDHFGGTKCGLWKSSERLQREKEAADLKKETENLTERLNLEKERDLLNLQEKFTRERENIIFEQKIFFTKEIEKEKQENEVLKQQLRELQNQQLVHRTIAEITKRHSEELERLSKDNKTLSQINITTKYTDQIRKLTEEKKNLETKVKELTLALSVKNANFPSFNDQPFNFKQPTYGYNQLSYE